MIKGVIFDFDGLILDTETYQYEMFKEIFNTHSVELPFERWVKGIGTKSNFSLFDYLTEHSLTKFNLDEIKEKFRKDFIEGLKNVVCRDGIRDYPEEASNLGLSIGLASSSNFEWVSMHLKNLELFDYFSCIKTSDDVEKVKPSPELYINTAKCLGLDPKECIVFEDSANGAIAAKSAEMKCVIVPNSITNNMNFCAVDLRLKSMSDISLNELIKGL